MFWLLLLAIQGCTALLEEPIVTFENSSSDNYLDIAGLPIISAGDDYIGVHIAVESLSRDLEEITGQSSTVLQFTEAELDGLSGSANSIIAGSINSTVIQRLVNDGAFSINEIEGKWETFKTEVVENPLPGVNSALVIAGSDKRGTIYGIHTLAEQSGQSP